MGELADRETKFRLLVGYLFENFNFRMLKYIAIIHFQMGTVKQFMSKL